MTEFGDPIETRRRGADYSAPALEKGFDIVELLAATPDGLTAKEIAERLDRSMSQLFRMIVVMEQRGWLERSSHDSRYRVSYKLLELAFNATPVNALARAATPLMDELARNTGQACHIVVEHDRHGLVVMRQENHGAIGLAVRLGTSINLVNTCSGHVLLAFRSPSSLPALVNRLVPQDQQPQLLEHLAQVRARGYETMPSSRVAGVHDISFPVFGFGSRLAAALTIPFLTLLDGSQLMSMDEVIVEGRKIASQISAELGSHQSQGARI